MVIFIPRFVCVIPVKEEQPSSLISAASSHPRNAAMSVLVQIVKILAKLERAEQTVSDER